MNIKKLQALFLFLCLFNFVALMPAQSSEYYLIKYKVESGDTITKIFKSFIKDDSVMNINSPFVQKTLKSNPQIKKWSNIPPETLIQLYISDDFIDLNKMNKYKSNLLSKVSAKTKDFSPTIKKLSLFYMSSLGKFSQESSTMGKINFNQNSPYSIGTSFSIIPKDKTFSYSFSAYYSYLKAGQTSGGAGSIYIPPEYGGNAYFEYRWNPNGIAVYTGPDYEAFSAFSNSGLTNFQKYYIDRLGMLYWTLGIAKSFTIFNQPLYFKISASRSLISSSKDESPASLNPLIQGDKKYSGNRYTFYLN